MSDLPIQFFVTCTALSFAMQTLILGLSRFYRARPSDPMPYRAPVPLTLLLTRWLWAGLAVFPLFAVSTVLSLMSLLLRNDSSLNLMGLNIPEMSNSLAGMLSLIGWGIIIWMVIDFTWISLKRTINRIGLAVIAWISYAAFVSTGVVVEITGILTTSLNMVLAGVILASAGYVFLIAWLRHSRP